jgi:cytochrome oxidase Cu insertion factor (SCO1/SenC/PrrC family)
MTASRLRLALYIFTGFVVGGLIALAVLPEARARLFPGATLKTMGQALVGGPFTLTDHTGKRVTDQDFRGRFMMVFFGFTFCPDVCPTALQVMAAALDKIGSKAEQITPVLITVDPERDTPEQMAMYVKSFHPRLVGLTGSPEEIAAVAKAYRAYFKRVPDPKSSGGYTMDHSAIIYVMGPDGAFRTHFTYTVDANAMAERLTKLLP